MSRKDRWGKKDWGRVLWAWKELINSGHGKKGRAFKENFLDEYCRTYRPQHEQPPKAKSMETAMKDLEVMHWERSIRKGGEEKWHMYRCREDPRYRFVLKNSTYGQVLDNTMLGHMKAPVASLIPSTIQEIDIKKNSVVEPFGKKMKEDIKEKKEDMKAPMVKTEVCILERSHDTIHTDEEGRQRDARIEGNFVTKKEEVPELRDERGTKKQSSNIIGNNAMTCGQKKQSKITSYTCAGYKISRPKRQKHAPKRFDPCGKEESGKPKKRNRKENKDEPVKASKKNKGGTKVKLGLEGSLNGRRVIVSHGEIMSTFHKEQYYWDSTKLRSMGITLVTATGEENQEMLRIAWSEQASLHEKEKDKIGMETSAKKVDIQEKIRKGNKAAIVKWREGAFFEFRGSETKASLKQYPGKKLLPVNVAKEFKRQKGLIVKKKKTKPWKAGELQGCMRRYNPYILYRPGQQWTDSPKDKVDCGVENFYHTTGMENIIAQNLRCCISQANQGLPTDTLEVIIANMRYSMEHRPKSVKVILLFESPGHTPARNVVPDHELCSRHRDIWKGQVYTYTNQLYNPTYGVKAAMQGPNITTKTTGTPSFWKLIAEITDTNEADVMIGKRGKKEATIRDLLGCRIKALKKLHDMGIWFLDVSPGGLYFPDQDKYQWGANGQAQKRPSDWCSRLAECLIMSWEIYTKHLVRSAFDEGELKAIIPMAKRVGNHLSIARIRRAVDDSVKVFLPQCHPNTWLKKGKINSHRRKISLWVKECCD